MLVITDDFLLISSVLFSIAFTLASFRSSGSVIRIGWYVSALQRAGVDPFRK